MTYASALQQLSEFEIDVLAAEIRRDALSGYRWNVPSRFEDAHPKAQEVWRNRARHRLGVASTIVDGVVEEAKTFVCSTKPSDPWLQHPRLNEFRKWMRETGAAKRNAKSFPANFQHWLEGGTW